MSSGTDYVFDGFARPCDVCGTPRAARDLQLRDGIAICSRHRGYRTAKELDLLNAKIRIPVPVLPKYTRPLSPIPTWELEEGRIFDLAINVAPFDFFDTTSDGAPGILGNKSIQAASWAAIYLAAVVSEGKRPAIWRARALLKLVELGDYLISQQNTTSTTIGYGSFSASISLAVDMGAGCLALCRIYQALGTKKYLDAAALCPNAIVNLQAANLLAAGADPTFYGPPHSQTSSLGLFGTTIITSSAICMWAESVLLGLVGDGIYGATTTLAGIFTSAPARLLSVSIAQQRAFWENGFGGVNGLTAATPRTTFTAATGTWVAGVIFTNPWAIGLRSLYETTGATAQVKAAATYLASLGQAPGTTTPAGTPTKILLQGASGTFDPTIAPPSLFDPATALGAFSLYDYASAGLLAPLLSPEAAKDAIGTPRPRTAEGSPRDGRSQYLGRLGTSGYSFQPWSDLNATLRQERVTNASQAGLLYRVNPATMGSH